MMYAARWSGRTGDGSEDALSGLQRAIEEHFAEIGAIRSLTVVAGPDDRLDVLALFDDRVAAEQNGDRVRRVIEEQVGGTLTGNPDEDGGIVAAHLSRPLGEPAQRASGQPVDGSAGEQEQR